MDELAVLKRMQELEGYMHTVNKIRRELGYSELDVINSYNVDTMTQEQFQVAFLSMRSTLNEINKLISK
jgi:cupin superfamily acireductone dioxygenase involved in methionine salvage